MFPDSKNPFAAAAAPRNGAAPNPFQAASGEGRTPSPFEAATPAASAQTALPEPKAASPFAVVADSPAATPPPSPFEAVLSEPTEGFAAPAAQRHEPTPLPVPVPVSMPSSRPFDQSNGSGSRDPFAAPSPSSQSRPTDFVLPAEAPAAQQSQPAPAAPAAAASRPSSVPAVNGETSQLVLRAIFGIGHDLDRTEILQRARTLPGVRNLQVVGPVEAAAMATLREGVQRMGFGDQASLTLTTSGGVLDIIEEPGTTLAVLHEGGYAAGVRETLIIISRELARLD